MCLLVADRELIWLKMLIFRQTSSFTQFALLHKPSWYHKEVAGKPSQREGRSHNEASTLKRHPKKIWDQTLRHGQALPCLCICRQSTTSASQQRSHLDLTVVENYFESHNPFSRQQCAVQKTYPIPADGKGKQ